MNTKTYQNTKGFTLVELLVVITIIGILAVGGLSLFAAAQQKARDSVRLTDIRAITTSVEQISMDRVGGDQTGDGKCKKDRGYPETGKVDNLKKVILNNAYLDRLPEDPQGVGDYMYRYVGSPNCLAYELSVKFEHTANQKKHLNDYDLGNDPEEGEDAIDGRFELGTPNCIGKTVDLCADQDVLSGLNTSEAATDIEYEAAE